MPALIVMGHDDLKNQAERLRALWKSGRDKYVSFFAVLNEVRQVMGDDVLPAWCFDELRISLSVIGKARHLLTAMDAEIVKADLTAARKAEKDQREAEIQRRQLERAEHERKIAEVQRETAQQKDAVDKIEGRKQQRDRRAKNSEEQRSADSAKATRRITLNNIENIDMAELAQRYKRAEEQCVRGENYWIEGNISKAVILAQMRAKNPANRNFGDALVVAGIDLCKDERAALLGLIALGQDRMREILRETKSRDLDAIWRANKPILKVV